MLWTIQRSQPIYKYETYKAAERMLNVRRSLEDQLSATIYQYKLIRRITIRSELRWSHACIAILFFTFHALMYGVDGLIACLLGFCLLQLIQQIILLLTFIRVEMAEDRRWNWRLGLPWIGYRPAGDLTFSAFRRVHRHLFWVGLCFVALLYPWISESLMISLVSWQLWTLGPRLLLIRSLRRERSDGVLRLQSHEVSYYHR
ncbi:transposase [Paenibacillus sp. GCM10023252]|uniref:transposase n=1 Tax=Paenibacillus sp. GCM10023252 TaxID=3252649 RepID=UPI003616698F